MTDTEKIENCDVAIIGSGPSGLAAATLLKQSGIQQVVVLERESEAGGIPRHCGHPPFGIREFKRVLTGPKYGLSQEDAEVEAWITLTKTRKVLQAQAAAKDYKKDGFV